MMNIWLLRHIETDYNSNGLILGQLDVSPINLNNVSIFLPDCILSEKIKIYSSSLTRCVITSQLLSEKICAVSDIKPLVEYTDMLKERNMGLWEGKNKDDVIFDNPKMFKKGMFIPQLTPPNGENIKVFIKRAQWLKSKLLKEESNNVVICSHNQFLKLFYHISINDLSLQKWTEISFKHGVLTRLDVYR